MARPRAISFAAFLALWLCLGSAFFVLLFRHSSALLLVGPCFSLFWNCSAPFEVGRCRVIFVGLTKILFVSLIWRRDACFLAFVARRPPVLVARRGILCRPLLVACLVASALVIPLVFWFCGRRVGRQFRSRFGEVFDGPEGHAVLLLHPA